MIVEICPMHKCTGCMSCYNLCPVNAIKICTDAIGFYRPVIQSNCIECHQCQNNCPSINVSQKLKEASVAYAAYKKQRSLQATSGGVATTFYLSYAKKSHASLYGVCFDANVQQFRFVRRENGDDVSIFSGSKYVQAFVGDAYKRVKKDLKSDMEVMFVGTPCQVQGLNSYLQYEEYPKLLTIDIVCHGCPSQKMLFDSFQTKDLISKITFREKTKYAINVTFRSGISQRKATKDSLFFEGFHNGRILGECCHTCPYAGKARTGDISLGDFWGLSKESETYDELSNGVSLVLINTEKGAKAFSIIEPFLFFEKRTLKEAVAGNTQLRHAVYDTRYGEKFRRLYIERDFEKAIKGSRNIKEIIKHLPLIRNICARI